MIIHPLFVEGDFVRKASSEYLTSQRVEQIKRSVSETIRAYIICDHL